MAEANRGEIEESINDLKAYRERLHQEFTKASQKLKMSQKKVESALENHRELNQLDMILKKLESLLSQD